MPVTALGEHVIRYAQRVLNDAKHFVEDIEIYGWVDMDF